MKTSWHSSLTTVTVNSLLESGKYVTDDSISTALFLALKLNKPLLIEGEPGSGKTEIAKVASEMLETKLIRLQCYEGLDISTTLYEWDYLRQLLKIRMEEGKSDTSKLEPELFSDRYLLKRPLLEALTYSGDRPPILLIDEIDRADEEFEGFLLEFLAEFQVTIPEVGTIKSQNPPVVIITSNRTRELGDGLRRRCLYLYIDYPSLQKELKIVRLKVPQIDPKLADAVCQFIQKVRATEDMIKKPGVSETLDWSSALAALGRKNLDSPVVNETISCLIKNPEDLRRLDKKRIADILKSTV